MLKRLWLLLLVAALLLGISACGNKAAEPAQEETLVTDPITLVDETALVVRVLKIEPEAEAGYTVSVMVWNKTDMDLKFFFDNLTVNDLLYGQRFQLEVKAEQKGLLRITLDTDKLQKYNLTKVTKMAFRFYAKNTDPLYDDMFFDQTLSVFPLGEAAYKPYQRLPGEADVTLLDNEYCSVTFVDVISNDTDFLCTVYVENKTDKNLLLIGKKLMINESSRLYQELSINPGIKSYETIFISKDTAGVLDFEAIQSLTGEVQIYDWAHYPEGPLATDTISIP